jgi:hypothetical protein
MLMHIIVRGYLEWIHIAQNLSTGGAEGSDVVAAADDDAEEEAEAILDVLMVLASEPW